MVWPEPRMAAFGRFLPVATGWFRPEADFAVVEFNNLLPILCHMLVGTIVTAG